MKASRLLVLTGITLIYGMSNGCNTDDPINPNLTGNPTQFGIKQCVGEGTNMPSVSSFHAVISNREFACPIRLNNFGQAVSYTALGTFVKAQMQHTYGLAVFDADGNAHSANVTAAWTGDDVFDYVQPVGSYPAGIAGQRAVQEDKLVNTMFVSCGGISSGCVVPPSTVTIHATYGLAGASVTFEGPSTVVPNQTFLVNADVNDPDLVPPLTWTWTHNGSPLAEYGDYFWYPGADMGYDHEFNLTVTDVNGYAVSGTYYVHTLNCTGGLNCLEY